MQMYLVPCDVYNIYMLLLCVVVVQAAQGDMASAVVADMVGTSATAQAACDTGLDAEAAMSASRDLAAQPVK